jgi:hypothetical protein
VGLEMGHEYQLVYEGMLLQLEVYKVKGSGWGLGFRV